MNEGYIKFQCNWVKKEILIPAEVFSNLEKYRSELYQLGLIGMYPNGIGFGNISVKNSSGSFYITGSATGKYPSLETRHYAEVLSYNFAQNRLSCIGLTKASAESLTHAAVYEAIPEVRAVVHVHCLWLWEKLLDNYPTTSPEIEYGTPEMAIAVRELATETATQECKIIVMGGHEEGILAFGRNLEEATNEIIKIYNRYQND
jgi:ribulose-5-phosphate 4-epimerase/fuculose-1-phosphate aldolase